jgi:hypothetical protein
VATILGSSLTSKDATVVDVSLPAIQADLQATIADAQFSVQHRSLVCSERDVRRHKRSERALSRLV